MMNVLIIWRNVWILQSSILFKVFVLIANTLGNLIISKF